MMGPGLGGWDYTKPFTGTRISLDQASEAARQFVATSNNPDLKVAEVLEFQFNFYAAVKEQSTGVNAFELLIDPYSSFVAPEMGPNMMWNTKYGHMAQWWGQAQTPTATMAIDAQKAQQAAQQFLDAYAPGTTTGAPDAFYGYYTLEVMKDGKVTGMLSVNGTTGQVWYHMWHGDFIRMSEESAG